MANITTSLFQEMVQAGATRLNKQAEYVNSLNVFPVQMEIQGLIWE